MGNNYSHQHHALFLSQHATRPTSPNLPAYPLGTTCGLLTDSKQPQKEQVTLISKICANYVSKLSGYYVRLYEKLPKSVVLWTIQQVQTWLDLIGMKQQSGKFRNFLLYSVGQLAIDGSSVFLMELIDLRDEIGLRSEMSLGIFQAWLEVGFKEYQNYVQSKQKQDDCAKAKERNIAKMNMMIDSVNRACIKQQPKLCPEIKLLYSEKAKKNEADSKLINTEKSRANIMQTSGPSVAIPQEHSGRWSRRLQVFDKRSNICLQIENFPLHLIEQFESIYRQLSTCIASREDQKESKVKHQELHLPSHEETTKSSKILWRGVLREQLRQSPFRQFCHQEQTSIYDSFRQKQYENILKSIELVVTKTTSVNKMEQYRLSLMADPTYQIGGRISDSRMQQKGQDQHHRRRCNLQYQEEQEYQDRRRIYPQINAYLLLNQPILIQRPMPAQKTKTNLCKSQSQSCSRSGRTEQKVVDFDGDWSFHIGNFTFVPEFQMVEIGQTEVQIEMQLSVVGTNTTLKIDPNQPSFNQKGSSDSSQCQHPVFYIVTHPDCRYPQIIKSDGKDLTKWRGSEVERVGAIVYIKSEKQYYLCEPKYVNSFIKTKLGELKQLGVRKTLAIKDDVTKINNPETADDEDKMFRSRGLRKQECRKEDWELETTVAKAAKSKPSEKYTSNRQEYQQSRFENESKIWVKLPINCYSNKLSSGNSIRITRGTTIKLGRREYIFNINTTVVKQIDNWASKERTDRLSPYRNVSQTSKCILCYERQVNCVYLDCRHCVTCIGCGKVLEKCPICRSTIQDYLQVFME